MTPETGRRRADERRAAAPDDDRAATPRTDDQLRSHFAPGPSTGPESDGAMTMPRSSRADRRRDGLLPSGEDPMIRRPGPRPAGGPPPGGGRRRTDLDPSAAPGRPPLTGERRQLPPAGSLPRQSPAGQSPNRRLPAAPLPAAPLPAASLPAASQPAASLPAASLPTEQSPVVRTPRPAASPAISGPMTAAVAPAAAAPRRPVPPAGRSASAAVPGQDVVRPAVAPETTGMPSWAADPAPIPLDMTQRVSGAVPAESPWGASAASPAAEPAPAVDRATPVRSAPLRPARSAAAELLLDPATDEQDAAPAAESRSRRPVDVPVGGRAAARLERQAAEAARKKAGGRRTGPPDRGEALPAATGPGRDVDADADPPRAPRRLAQGLIAVVVIAVAVLGFWSFTTPKAQEVSSESPAPSSSPVAPTQAATATDGVAPATDVVPAPVVPVFAPVTVVNSTSINGLAGDVGDQLAAGGWEIAGTGASPVEDVATTTVYYTEGDPVQEQAATQLVEQFPEVSGPAPRYFEVTGVAAPGLVVVVTGNWTP